MLLTFRSKLRSQSASEQSRSLDARVFGGQLLQQRRVDVGGDHPRTFGGAGQRTGAADALRRCGDEHRFAFQSSFMHGVNLGC
jgi:hypothetical protein